MTFAQTSVTSLQKHQSAKAAHALSRAFYDDPMYTYMLPEVQDRLPRLNWFFSKTLHLGRLQGETYSTASTDGAAIWLPPGKTNVSTLNIIRSGLLLGVLHLGWGGSQRLLNCVTLFEERHKHNMPMEHWYLMILGIDPDQQGHGIGGALLQPVFAKADAEKYPCYLETLTRKNIAFYKKHGFSVIGEGHVPKGGPIFWEMRRDPQLVL